MPLVQVLKPGEILTPFMAKINPRSTAKNVSLQREKKKSLSKYADCLKYIKGYWPRITFYHPKDKGKNLGLPNRSVSPSTGIFRNDQFYWDSYFIILGLVKEKKVELAKGMVENFVYLFKRFDIIPMRNRYYNLGTSQIPFFTSMIFEVFEIIQQKGWLKKMAETAADELSLYWMNEKLTEKHLVHKGLSRYCDHYITHLGAEHESGWDMTSRFHDRCLDYLPVDLNSCLYKYETDLARAFEILKNPQRSARYKKQAAARKKQMNELMWNEKIHFFCDYNYRTRQHSQFLSVAGFYPLWSRLASPEQAAAVREHVLPLFEVEFGITNTQKENLSSDLKQHDHPNGWPHQQFIVIQGLLNYGYREDAKRLAVKWLDMNKRIYEETGKFWERYHVVKGNVVTEDSDRYVLQSGFGWTNAVFVRLCHEFELL
jgi:alpha,alpha-trehalase